MGESLLEPVEANKDDNGVDEDGSADTCAEHEDDLLVEVQGVDINGVEAGLSSGAGAEEQGVDVVHVGILVDGVSRATGVDDDGEYDGGKDDVGVVDSNVVESWPAQANLARDAVPHQPAQRDDGREGVVPPALLLHDYSIRV